jgi:hypothetical protein
MRHNSFEINLQISPDPEYRLSFRFVGSLAPCEEWIGITVNTTIENVVNSKKDYPTNRERKENIRIGHFNSNILMNLIRTIRPNYEKQYNKQYKVNSRKNALVCV